MLIIIIAIILFILYCILKSSANAEKLEEQMRKTTITNRK